MERGRITRVALRTSRSTSSPERPERPGRLVREVRVQGVAVDARRVVVELESFTEVAPHAASLIGRSHHSESCLFWAAAAGPVN